MTYTVGHLFYMLICHMLLLSEESVEVFGPFLAKWVISLLLSFKSSFYIWITVLNSCVFCQYFLQVFILYFNSLDAIFTEQKFLI